MGIPLGEARQCTPAGTEAVISALALTAPPPTKVAQNATTVDTRNKTFGVSSLLSLCKLVSNFTCRSLYLFVESAFYY